MTYEKLLDEAEKNDIHVIEDVSFQSQSEGLINGDVIGISKKVRTYTKKSCILAEELGHYHTAVGDIVLQTSTANRKQELSGRIWAYNKLVGLQGIVQSYKNGCQSLTDSADCLEVTEEFLAQALQYYKSKYGNYTILDNYIIYFEPSLSVLEIIQT